VGLKLGAGFGAQAQDGFGALVGVFEHQVAAFSQVLTFPLVLKSLQAFEHVEPTKFHQTHVDRSHFGLEGQGPLGLAAPASCTCPKMSRLSH
jgi:hypothetical protein